jgi:hypothetical protein
VALRTDLKSCFSVLSVCISCGSSHGSHFNIILRYPPRGKWINEVVFVCKVQPGRDRRPNLGQDFNT